MSIFARVTLAWILSTLSVWTSHAASPVSAVIQHAALPKKSYSVGEKLRLSSTVTLAGDVSGTYHVEIRLNELATGGRKAVRYFYDQTFSSGVAATFALDYVLPAGLASGAYTFSAEVWRPNWKGVPATQVALPLTIRVPSASAAVQHAALPKTRYAVGESVPLSSSILLAGADRGTYHVEMRLTEAATGGVRTLKHFYNQSLSSKVPQRVALDYSVPDDLLPGSYSYDVLVWQVDWKGITVSQNPGPLQWSIPIALYQPSPPPPMPDSVVRLKPRLPGSDPLKGAGFVPDTTETFSQVFGDEFDGSQLDVSKWWTRYVYGGGTLNHLNDECQLYGESNTHPVSGGTLQLVARPVAGKACPGKTSNPAYQAWDSGMIRSKTVFRYGYFETRVRMPAGVGVWPAFWLNPEDQGWPPEIDIFEFVVNGKTEHPNMLHSGVVVRDGALAQAKERLYSDPNFNTTWGYFRAPASLAPDFFAADFHVISAYWSTDDRVTVYLDGVPILQHGYKWVHNDGSDAGFAHVLLNLAMGGSWPTAGWTMPMASTEQRFVIDYVRVWQTPSMIPPQTSSIGKDLCPVGGGC